MIGSILAAQVAFMAWCRIHVVHMSYAVSIVYATHLFLVKAVSVCVVQHLLTVNVQAQQAHSDWNASQSDTASTLQIVAKTLHLQHGMVWLLQHIVLKLHHLHAHGNCVLLVYT